MAMCECCEEKEAVAKFTCNCNKKSQYCSSDCKVISSRRHKNCLSFGSLRSVDFLIMNVYDDQLPLNGSTIKDYGFANCKCPFEWTELFGLYIGLIKILQLPIDVLHDYCMKNAIGDIIIEKFLAVPEPARGEYFSWFLQHQDIVKNGRASVD